MWPERARAGLAAVAVAGLLTVTGCGAGPNEGQGLELPPQASTVTDVLDGQRVRLDLPTTDATTGLALWFHGQHGDVDSYLGSDWLDGLRARGWAVASSDLHGNAWGSPEAVQDVRALAAWATTRADAEVRLLIAGSMGGVTSLNAVLAGAVSAPCWYGTEPVVDLTSVTAVPGAAEEIARAHGDPLPDDANPVTRLAELPVSMRYAAVASAADTWVPAAANADVLVTALRARGATVVTVAATGPHGDRSHYRPEDLAAFADGCTGEQ